MSGYISNVPLSNQTLAQTQPTINNNFTQLNTIFGVDHVDYTNAAPGVGIGGRHNTVSLVQQFGNPTAIATSPIVFSKSTTSNTLNNDIYFRRASNDGSNVIQLTSSAVLPVNTSSGTTFLPGGMILKWGSELNVSTAGTLITYPTAFPTAAFLVVATVRSATSGKTISVVNTTNAANFTAIVSSVTDISWIAIGN